jgi:hypothetical protein
VAGYRLRVRVGSRVERSRHDDAAAALEALESRLGQLRREARGRTVDLKVRRFEPVQQVTARLELSGPGRLRVGLDLRGDGSTEAWTGRVRRQLIEQRGGEEPLDALRRVLPSARMREDGAATEDRRWIVPLPRGAEPPYRVFVNGVRQHEGSDYELRGHALAFPRHLEKEGRLGFWRWTAMFLALFGTYRKNDSVDVEYTVGGQPRLAVGLDILPPDGGKHAAGS